MIDESTRRFLLTLWHTASFFVTYANLDGCEPGPPVPAVGTSSTAGSGRGSPTTVETVTDALEGFDALERGAGPRRLRRRPVELVRAPVPAPVLEVGRPGAAAATLHECLVTVTLLLAPFCPFTADELYRVVTPSAGVGAPRRLARLDAPASRRRPRGGHGGRPPARHARARGPQRRQARRSASRCAALVGAARPASTLDADPRGAGRRGAERARVSSRCSDLEGLLKYTVVTRLPSPRSPCRPADAPGPGRAAAADGAEAAPARSRRDGRLRLTARGRRVDARARRRRPARPGARGVGPRRGRGLRGRARHDARRRAAQSRAWPGRWSARSTISARCWASTWRTAIRVELAPAARRGGGAPAPGVDRRRGPRASMTIEAPTEGNCEGFALVDVDGEPVWVRLERDPDGPGLARKARRRRRRHRPRARRGRVKRRRVGPWNGRDIPVARASRAAGRGAGLATAAGGTAAAGRHPRRRRGTARRSAPGS